MIESGKGAAILRNGAPYFDCPKQNHESSRIGERKEQ
jgi:hypothetical protein